ncbi:MAG: branched-chain amino acid transport system permease protein livM, partial [Solirubrobacteraceae bacterium]|nr:branched-chain amino acid transport system permease protein livM [Solirubrobacteraceae bacterium]
MREFILYTISGLTTASIYAISASGLTLTYTTTGVFNFAHGAIGMVAAFAYWQLRFAWGVPAVVSFAVVLLVLAPLFGLALERVIMRRLEGTSDVTKLVVTVALLLGLVSFALWVWDPNELRTIRPMWSGHLFVWGIVRVTYNDIAVLVVAGLVAFGLRILLYRTRAGVAMRATVDDPNLAMLNGSRSVTNARLAWAIGTSLAALAGILLAPLEQLNILSLTLLVINGYAAALFGSLRSLPRTAVGAILLGLVVNLARGYVPGGGILEHLEPALPMAFLFAVLLFVPP